MSFLPPNSTVTVTRERAGIDRVLDELLDDRGRPLDHLAGGDLVGQVRGQPMNARHRHLVR